MNCPFCGSDKITVVFGGFICQKCGYKWKITFPGSVLADKHSATAIPVTDYLKGIA